MLQNLGHIEDTLPCLLHTPPPGGFEIVKYFPLCYYCLLFYSRELLVGYAYTMCPISL